MSATITAAGLMLPMAEEGGHFPPTPGDFWQPLFAIPGTEYYFTRPMLLILVSGIALTVWLWLTTRHAAVVPGKAQWITEQVYNFARNGIARDMIGSRDFMRFVPYLVALFFFILFNNLLGIIPFIQFPTFSRAGIAYGLALLSWVVYNYAGVRKFGLGGYLRRQTVPTGVAGPILVLLVPLEFFSNIIVRPVTLALRLFANMFAGHMLLILFALGGEYLLFETSGLTPVAGALSFVMFMAVSVLELLVMALQAYVFVLLTAMYISSSLVEEH